MILLHPEPGPIPKDETEECNASFKNNSKQ